MLGEGWAKLFVLFYLFDLIHMLFSLPHILNSGCKSKDCEIKNSTIEYWDISDSNQTEFDLKNISEYCEHLVPDVF